jgi:transcriptional regulator with XRE-family HTH domain
VVDDQPSKFSKILFAARSAKGLGVRQAAKAIGISHSRLIDFEAGFDQHTGRPCMPSTATLFRLAAAYDLDVTDLLAHAGFKLPGLPLTPEERGLLTAFRALPEIKMLELASYLARLQVEG